MIITFRVINSFEYQTVLYMPLEVGESDTLATVQQKVNERIMSENKFRPARGKISRFNMFKEFTRPGVAKTGELCIQQKGEEWAVAENAYKTLKELNWEHGLEVSYYIAGEDY